MYFPFNLRGFQIGDIIKTTTTTTKNRPDKGNKRNLSRRTKNPPKYMEKQTIFPSAKYQRTVNPPSN